MNVTGIEQGSYFLGRLSSKLGGRDLLPHLAELHASELPRRFEAIVAGEPAFATKRFDSIWRLRLYRIWVYCLVRALRPRVFVETGVLHGMLSAFVLEALARNGEGRLVSIDLPSYAESGPANVDGYTATLPPGREPGWLVPEALRERYADRIQARIARHSPNFESSIVARTVLSPVDLQAANINLVHGDPYGGSLALDQNFLWRPLASQPGHRTPVDGVWHVGASTHPGPGLGGGSGALVAAQLLEPTLASRVVGRLKRNSTRKEP